MIGETIATMPTDEIERVQKVVDATVGVDVGEVIMMGIHAEDIKDKIDCMNALLYFSFKAILAIEKNYKNDVN